MGSYTLIMSRWVCALLFSSLWASSAGAQQEPKEQPKAASQQQAPQEQEPPEEDEALKPKVYAFNPLQANKDIQAGDFYFHKHSYKAAAMRFREATKWNPGSAEAWLRLGEAEEKRKNDADAKQAYAKYLELAPDGKEAGEIRKKLAKLH
jgi:tetratricopeptide (TPR) repeat protein